MRKSIWKRALSLVLSLAMLLTLVPAFDVLPEAEAETRAAGPQGNYITLPITIRDFAADGMLFEYNEVDWNSYPNCIGEAKYLDALSILIFLILFTCCFYFLVNS